MANWDYSGNLKQWTQLSGLWIEMCLAIQWDIITLNRVRDGIVGLHNMSMEGMNFSWNVVLGSCLPCKHDTQSTHAFRPDNDDDTHDHLSGSALQLSHRSEATSYMQYKPCVVKGISLSCHTDCLRAGSGRPLIIAATGLDCQGTSHEALSSSLFISNSFSSHSCPITSAWHQIDIFPGVFVLLVSHEPMVPWSHDIIIAFIIL